MKMSRILVFAATFAMTALLIADDGLLGEKRGSGEGGGDKGGSVGSGGGSRGNGGGSGGQRGNSGGSSGNRGGSGGSNSDRGRGEEVRGGGSSNNGGGIIGRPGSSGSGSTRVQSQRQGRSGTIDYRSQNNQNRGRVESGSTRVQSVPNYRGSIESQSRDERRLPYDSRYRTGYTQYNSRWCDDDFWYPYYGFRFEPRNTIFSPWYCYSNLPGYINIGRVRFGSVCVNVDIFQPVRWDYNRRYDRYSPYYALDTAVDDISNVFNRRDMRALDRLVPRNDWVQIKGEWERDYEIRSDDYYDMMRDLVNSTNTRSFRIDRVEEARGYARVLATHTYSDAGRYDSRVSMEFILEQDRRGSYVITEFGTYLNDRW